MKTSYTAKELMSVAIEQITKLSRKRMEKRMAQSKRWAREKMKREGWKNADTFRRTVK